MALQMNKLVIELEDLRLITGSYAWKERTDPKKLPSDLHTNAMHIVPMQLAIPSIMYCHQLSLNHSVIVEQLL